MGDFKVRVGDLRHRITIQKYTTIITDNGFDEEKWTDYKTIWASMNNLFGKEFYAAKAVQAENTIEFVVRYSKDLGVLDSKEYRIKVLKNKDADKEEYKYKFFNITFIDNIKYANKWLKIKAIEVM